MMGAMILLLIAMVHHTALGLQMVIEDYVHSGVKLAGVVRSALAALRWRPPRSWRSLVSPLAAKTGYPGLPCGGAAWTPRYHAAPFSPQRESRAKTRSMPLSGLISIKAGEEDWVHYCASTFRTGDLQWMLSTSQHRAPTSEQANSASCAAG
jgi:hypothetical protein